MHAIIGGFRPRMPARGARQHNDVGSNGGRTAASAAAAEVEAAAAAASNGGANSGIPRVRRKARVEGNTAAAT